MGFVQSKPICGYTRPSTKSFCLLKQKDLTFIKFEKASTMKLTKLPRAEATMKLAVAIKKSTADALARYQAFYRQETGQDIAQKDLVEQMLIDFMASDKQFQRMASDSVGTRASADAKRPREVSDSAPAPSPEASESFALA